MKRIVFVDDDPDTLDALNLIFDPEEYEVTLYSNGNAILENQAVIPDVYVLDKQISGVDGLDICRFLKKQQRTSNIPVIILSASPYIKNQANEAGANDVLEKPFAIQELRNLVSRYV